MLGCNLGPGKVKVMVHHLQCCMPEDFFKRKYVPAVEQIVDSECVTAQVCMQSFHT